MSTLQGRLDRIRTGFLAQVPEDVKSVMHRATKDLRGSGIVDRLPQAGESLAPFELADSDGNVVRSADLLARGPLIATFYRGLW